MKTTTLVIVELEVGGLPVTQAYSIASANYDVYLEFFSIKVRDGLLSTASSTSRPATKSW